MGAEAGTAVGRMGGAGLTEKVTVEQRLRGGRERAKQICGDERPRQGAQ